MSFVTDNFEAQDALVETADLLVADPETHEDESAEEAEEVEAAEEEAPAEEEAGDDAEA